jgi:hypothetical protein
MVKSELERTWKEVVKERFEDTILTLPVGQGKMEKPHTALVSE